MRIENKMYRSLGRLNKLPASWREAVQTRLMGRFVPFWAPPACALNTSAASRCA